MSMKIGYDNHMVRDSQGFIVYSITGNTESSISFGWIYSNETIIKNSSKYSVVIDIQENTFIDQIMINDNTSADSTWVETIKVPAKFIGRMIVKATTLTDIKNKFILKPTITNTTTSPNGKIKIRFYIIPKEVSNFDVPSIIETSNGIKSIGENLPIKIKSVSTQTSENDSLFVTFTDEPNRSLPNGVSDLTKVDTKIKNTKVGKHIINGSGNIALISELTNTVSFLLSDSPIIFTDYTNISDKLVCDKFIFDNSTTLDEDHYFINNDGITIFISRDKLKSDDVEGFVEYLNKNNIEILYELNYTGTSPISVDKSKLKTYYKGNIITIDDKDFKSELSIKMPVMKDGAVQPRIQSTLINIQPGELGIYARPKVDLALVNGKAIVGKPNNYLLVKKASEATLHSIFRATSTGFVRLGLRITDGNGKNISLEDMSFSKVKNISVATHNSDKTSIYYNQTSTTSIEMIFPMSTDQMLTVQIAQVPSVNDWAEGKEYDKNNPNLELYLEFVDNEKRLAINDTSIQFTSDPLTIKETANVTSYEPNTVYIDASIGCRPSQVAVCQGVAGAYMRHNDNTWGITCSSTDNIIGTKIAAYVGTMQLPTYVLKGKSILRGFLYTMGTNNSVTVKLKKVHNNITYFEQTYTLKPSDSVIFDQDLNTVQTPTGMVAVDYIEIIPISAPSDTKVICDLSTDSNKYLATYSNGKLTRYIRQDEFDTKMTFLEKELEKTTALYNEVKLLKK